MLNLLDYAGRRIVLTRNQWELHVLAVKPVMANRIADVQRVVQSPDFVNRDANYPTRLCFYGAYSGEHSHLMMKVVIHYDETSEGFLITAYPLSRPGSGEQRLWTKENS